MSITDFGDIASIVEWWHGGDVTTTGSVVDTMIGQVGLYDLANPHTYQSNPTIETNIGDAMVDGVNMTTSTKCQLAVDTGRSDDSYSYVIVLKLENDSLPIVEVLFDPRTGSPKTTCENGQFVFEYRFGDPLSGPLLSTGDFVVIICQRDDITGDSYIFWNGPGGSGSDFGSGISSYSLGYIYLGEFVQNCYTLLASAYYSEALTSTERDDIFNYAIETYITGPTGLAETPDSLFFGANF